MNACDIGFGFSIMGCASGIWAWLMAFVPGGFPAVAFLVGLTMGAMLGPKALAIALVVIGFVLGRRSMDAHEHVDGADAEPTPRRAKRKGDIR